MFSAPDESGSLLILDRQRDKVDRVVSASIRAQPRDTWVLLADSLLNYVEWLSFVRSQEDVTNYVPSIALFDLQGKQLASLNPPAPSGVHSWGLDYVGPLGSNGAVFTRIHTSPRPESTGELREPVADDLLVLDVPSLKVQRIIELGPRPVVADGVRTERSFHTASDGSLVLIVSGDVTFHTMTTNSVPHELRVEAYDAATGKSAWRHTEEVTIRKYSSGRSQ